MLGGSLANSRLTLSSRGVQDESVQVDLSADTITYDSDDEMAKRRSGILLRNKKGHPIYSREDIREQYCITRKEVEVLDNARSLKFFGCFPNPQESSISPCSKNSSYLFSCLHKKKKKKKQAISNSDENIYQPPQPEPYYDTDDTRSKEDLGGCSTEDDDDDYGFRKRPKTFFTDPNNRYGDSESDWGRRKLESSASFGSQQSYYYGDESEGDTASRGLRRPSQLNIAQARGRNDRFQPSRSVDELNDASATQRRSASAAPDRTAKTPDLSLDERRQKHVSFDNGSLVRSNTVAGGLGDVGGVEDRPVATSTPLYTQRKSSAAAFSPPSPRKNKSQERLLDGYISARPPSDFSDRPLSVASQYNYQESSSGYRGGSLQHRPRRALMRTQATQTELTFKARTLLPAYLTLSPRAGTSRQLLAPAPLRQPSTHHRTKTRHRPTKSQSAHTTLRSEDSDDEVMEVDLSTKHQHRLIRSNTSRASIRRQRAVEEEIMVSFKPAPSPPPKGNMEVLIGERPLSRSIDREHRKISSICRDTSSIAKSESQEDFLERSNAVEVTVRKCKTPSKETIKGLKEDLKTTEIKIAQKPVITSKPPEKEIISPKPKDPPQQPKAPEEFRKTPSEEKPSPEESSEVSGMKSPTKKVRTSRIKSAETVESSSIKSSSESSRREGRLSQPEWLSSSAEGSCSCQDKSSFDDSPAVTTDDGSNLNPEIKQALETAEKRRQEYLVKYREVKAKSESKENDPTSPDSESSSSIFTERETSRSEVSTSSSNRVAKSETEEDESSEYVTATDHTPHSPYRLSAPRRRNGPSEEETSFESFSSPSKSSSHRLQVGSGSSTSNSPLEFHSNGSPRRTEAADDISVYLSAALPADDVESSDESTKKETPPTTPSTGSENGHTPLHKLPHDTIGTPDSDRTSDITALFDPSPEPLSSLQEPQTVIEIRSEGTSEELLSVGYDDDDMDKIDDEDSFPRNNGERGYSESSESSSLLSGCLQDDGKFGVERLQTFAPLDIRKAVDELSTVSEVSEESSRNMVRVRRKKSDRKASEASSLSEVELHPRPETARGVSIPLSKHSSSSEYIPSETTTPDSTTSGSFVLDNGSYTTENESCNSTSNLEIRTEDSTSRVTTTDLTTRTTTDDSKTKTESESVSESFKDSKSSRTPLPADEDLAKHSHSETNDPYTPSSPPSDLSEKLVSLTLSSSSSVSHPPPPTTPQTNTSPWSLSAWCSEGAIPKQRHQEEGRRRKDRLRNRSEPREHVTALQFSRAERTKARSKSRSPEHKLSDDDSAPWYNTGARTPGQCSHCGAHQTPLSAPPDWDRGTYPRFWEQQQAVMWPPHRYARDTVSGYRGYSGGHCHVPRAWSGREGVVEMEMYPDEDEDAGVHSESYRSSSWIYISDSDELAVWKQTTSNSSREECEQHPSLSRSDSTDSTSSEHEFLKQYEIVTHRMIQRKCSVEMYKRIANRTFGTPAETCGLEVGDIIISINGLNVLDAPHGDVVRLAHTGTEILKMEVSRTCHVLAPVLADPPSPPVFSGYLQRMSARNTNRRWCRRWFAVKLDGVLYWYRTSKDHEPLGALGLQNQSISRVPEAGAPHAFKVSKLGENPFYFSADDEDTATRWISALNQVAATASRVDPYVEESLRSAQLPPISIPHVDCQGPLSKFSQRWKTWRRRYFLLKDAALYFYADRNAKVALGLFQLHGYKVQSSSVQGQKNAFEAVPPEPRLKHLYFLADSENEKKRWLSALDYSIDRWIKIG
ncbi:hypothetical protein JTE90_029367 [Oedothorax gibbosus]|uniref:Uncharacterized protein n=1 Tax=Oedothorax gibbosus TaxID=931172 RepID=A0AAV6VQ64_9ARAC|nr:hypothetical protein JTE90_029367 [Oedothorax gibbosus]